MWGMLGVVWKACIASGIIVICYGALSHGASTVENQPSLSWDNILEQSAVLVVLGFVVKWFMSHVESKDAAYREELRRKDEACFHAIQRYQEYVMLHEQKVIATQQEIVIILKLIAKRLEAQQENRQTHEHNN